MRICVPTLDDQGPKGFPSAHFGASPFFTFFDLVTGEWEAVPNRGSGHEHGACPALDALTNRPIDAVLCRGLGRGAFARLQLAGVDVYLAREPGVLECLEAFKEGRLAKLTETQLCQGHHDGHEPSGPGRGQFSGHEARHGSSHAPGRGQGRRRGASHDHE